MPTPLYPENLYNTPTDFASLYNKVKRYQSPAPANRQAEVVDISKYPFPYLIGQDNEELRAQSQSIWDQWGNALARTGSQLLFGTLKGITDMPDLFRAFTGPDGLAALADEEFSNDLSEGLGKLMENIKESHPVYLEKDERGFVPWKAAWWATNLDSIATGVSMLVPTVGVAKGAGWVTKMLGSLARAKGANALVMGKNGTTMIGSIFGALYGNAYESMQEMQQTLPELKAKMEAAGLSEEEQKKALKEEASKMYWGNLPNAALDMLGIYTLTKPMAGVDNIIETVTKKRLGKTALLEVVPEGIQELRNHFVTERSKANIDKLVGLRSDDYNLAEFWKDPNARTAGFFGALGGLAFAGGANAISQVEENIAGNNKAKQNWYKGMFKGVGKATITGITNKEQEHINEQQEVLSKLAIQKQRLSALSKVSELANDAELYKEVQNSMTDIYAIEHMAKGTYGRFRKHVDDVEAILNEFETDENATPQQREEVKQSKQDIVELKSGLDSLARYYNKGMTYYGFANGSNRLMNYALLSREVETQTAKLDTMMRRKEGLFTEDEHGILRQDLNPVIEEVKTQVEGIQATLDGTAFEAEDVEVQDNRDIEKKIKDIKKQLNTLEAKTVGEEAELAIARQSLNVSELKNKLKKVITKDENLLPDSRYDLIFDQLANEEYLKDIVYKAYNVNLSKSLDGGAAIEDIIEAISKDKKPITASNRDKIISKINARIEEESGSLNDKFKAALVQEGKNPDTMSDDIYEEEYAKKSLDLQNEIDKNIQNYNLAKNLAISLVNFNPKIRSKEEIIEEYLITQLNITEDVLTEIISNPENLDSTSYFREKHNLEEIKKSITNPSEQIRNKIANIEKLLDQIGLELRERFNNKDLQQAESFNKHFDIIINEIKKINSSFNSDNLLDIDAELTKIKADKANLDKVNESVDTLASILQDEIKKLNQDRTDPVFHLNNLKTYPEAALYTLISTMYYNQRQYEVSLNPNDIILDDKIAPVVETYKELIKLIEFKRALNKTLSYEKILGAIKLTANELDLFPFPEQLVSIFQLAEWYSTSRSTAYLSGVGGSGKSNMVAKFVAAMLPKLYANFKKEDVWATANSPRTDSIIRKSVLGLDTLGDDWVNKPNLLIDKLKDKKLLIIDEVGRLIESEVKTLREIVGAVNKDRSESSKLKLILTGDPNQLKGQSLPPAINGYYPSSFAKEAFFVHALTLSLRSNNSTLTEFQNKFLNAGDQDAFAINAFNEKYNEFKTSGITFTKAQEEFSAMILNKLRNDEDFVIIVEDQKQIDFYNRLLNYKEGDKKRVVLVKDSQGDEWDSVFIDLPIYSAIKGEFSKYLQVNSKYYTAISRARNFVAMKTTRVSRDEQQFVDTSNIEYNLAAEERRLRLEANKKNSLEFLNDQLGIKGEVVKEQPKPKEEDPTIKDEGKDPNEAEGWTEPTEVIEWARRINNIIKEPITKGPIPIDALKDVYPNYQGLRLLEKLEPNTPVIILRRRTASSDPNASAVEDLVYLVQTPEGEYMEVATKRVPKTSNAKLNYKRVFPKEEVDKFIADGNIPDLAYVHSFQKLTYHYDYSNPLPMGQAFSGIEQAFKRMQATVNRKVTSVKLTNYFVATDASILRANELLISKNQNLRLSKFSGKASDVEKGSADGAYLITPGQAYVLVETTTTDINGNNESLFYQILELEAAKYNGLDPEIQALNSFLNNVRLLEEKLNKEFKFDYEYGKIERDITIDDQLYTEGAVFLNALRFRLEGEDILTSSSFPMVIALHEAINKHKDKKTIIKQLQDVREALRTTIIVDPLLAKDTADFEKFRQFNNEFVALDNTRVKKLSETKVLTMLKDPTLYKTLTDKGFEFVDTDFGFNSLEARRTLEIVGQDPEGNKRVYHALITIPFEQLSMKDNRTFQFNVKAAPRIEIFDIDDSTYSKYILDEKNLELKSGSLKRIRKGYKDGEEEVNKVFDSTNSTILIPRGLSSLDNIEKYIKVILESGKEKNSPGMVQTIMNDIAQANAKINLPNEEGFNRVYITEHQRKAYKAYDEGTKKTRRIFGPSMLDSNLSFTILRETPDGAVITKGSGKMYEDTGEEILEYINLRQLLELIVNSKNYDSTTNDSIHNNGFGLRKAIHDRGLKAVNKSLNENGTAIENKGDRDTFDLADEFYKLRSTFVDIVDSSINIVPLEGTVSPTAAEEVKEESTDTTDTSWFRNIDSEDNTNSEEPTDPTFFEFNNNLITQVMTGKSLLNDKDILNYIKKYIPDITEEEVKMHVNAIIAMGKTYGMETLGGFQKGLIHLLRGTDGSINEEVIRHETFHKIFNQFLPRHVVNTLKEYVRAVNNNPNMSDLQVEEYLAERFQKFNLSNTESDNIFTRFFTWLRDLILSLFNVTAKYEAGINRVLIDIENGIYAKRLIANSDVSLEFKQLKNIGTYFPMPSLFDSIQEYFDATDYLKDIIYKFYIEDLLLPTDIAIETQNKLIRKINELEKKYNVPHSVIENMFNVKNTAKAEVAKLNIEPSEVRSMTNVMIRNLRMKYAQELKTYSNEFATVYYILSSSTLYTKLFEEVFPVKTKVDSDVDLEAIADRLRNELEIVNDDSEESDAQNQKTEHVLDLIQNVHTDQETKISKELKILLAFIKKPDGTYVPARYAYAKSIELLMFETFDHVTAKNLLNLAEREKANVNLAALAKKLNNVYTLASNIAFNFKAKEITLPTFAEFKGNEFYIKGKHIPIPANKSTSLYNDSVIQELKANGINESNEVLLEMVKQIKLKGLNKDLWAKLKSELASQAQSNPIADIYKTVEKYDPDLNEMYRERLYNTKAMSAAGIKENISETILSSLQSLLINNTFDQVSDFYRKIKSMKLDIIVNKLGLTVYEGKALSTLDDLAIRNNLEKILKDYTSNYHTVKNNINFLEEHTERQALRELSAVFLKNSDYLTTLNYKDSKGNSRYIYTMGAWVYDVLSTIAEGKSNDYLKGADWVVKNNIYTNKISKIHSVVNLDYMKELNTDFDAVAYKNFSPAQFIMHRFMNNFIGQLGRQKQSSNELVYNQYLYVQSNRNADTGASVDLLNQAELKKAFEVGIEFEKERTKYIAEKNIKIANYRSGKAVYFSKYKDFNEFNTEMNKQSIDAFISFVEELDTMPWLSLRSESSEYSVRYPISNLAKVIEQLINYKLLSEDSIKRLTDRITDKIPDLSVTGINTFIIFNAFYKQNYINGFNLNTLVFGDLVFTKDIEDLIKRMQSIQSPGKKQLVGELGNKKFSNAVAAEDTVRVMNSVNDALKIFSKLAGKIEITDAVTLGTPTTLTNIHKGTGDYNLKDIIKIVGKFNQDGVPHYIKTALFIITDELARMFPALAEVRKNMETANLNEKELETYNKLYDKIIEGTITVEEKYEYDNLLTNSVEFYVLKSAYKTGRPINLVKNGEKIDPKKHLVQFPNEFIRIQSNPYHHPGDVSDPSQFNYFTNMNGLNEEEAFKLYSLNAELMRLKFTKVKAKENLYTVNKEGKKIVNKKAITATITNEVENSPGSEIMHKLLKGGVDINFPLLLGRAIISMSNKVSKNSVEIRHSGNKLIAQSAFGVQIFELGGKIVTYRELTSEQKAKSKAFQALPFDVREGLIGIRDILSLDTVMDDGTSMDPVSYVRKYLASLGSMYGVKNTKQFTAIAEDMLAGTYNYLVPRRLRMRDSEGFTEVIAPRWWMEKYGVTTGDGLNISIMSEAYKDLLNTGMAVRIPTTGIHSAVAIKIVGDVGDNFNRIIAPEELVALHGSDFDIDSLFLMHREAFDENFTVDRDYKKGELIGYNLDGSINTAFLPNLEQMLSGAITDKDISLYNKLVDIKIKYILNQIVDNNIKIITALKNRDDMNTPISFSLIKYDVYNDVTLDIYKEHLFAQGLEDTDSTLKDFIDSKVDKQFADAVDLPAFRKGKLVVSEEVKKGLLDSPDYGYAGKLKLITERQSLKASRDPNNISHMMLYHKDNFEGSAGIGIQANMMKALAYLMYGSKFTVGGQEINLSQVTNIREGENNMHVTLANGTTVSGKLVRQPVDIAIPITLVSKGVRYEYDALERLTKKHGHKTYELGDTVLNGYIDNVKEQITYIINATGVTIEPIAFMIGIGMDLDTIGHFMNQPVMKSLGKSRIRLDKPTGRIALAKKQMLKMLQNMGVASKDLKALDTTLVEEDLIDTLAQYPNMSFEDLMKVDLTALAKNPTAFAKYQNFLKTQIKVIDNFERIRASSKQLGNFSRALSVLRNFPVTIEGMEEKREDFAKIKYELVPNTRPDGTVLEGMFNAPNTFHIPHIKEAMNKFEEAYTLVTEVAPLLSVAMKFNMDKLANDIGLEATTAVYKLNTKNRIFMKNEIEAIIVSRLVAKMKIDNKIPYPKHQTIDVTTGKFVDLAAVDTKTTKIRYLGEDMSIIQTFLSDLAQRKIEEPSLKANKFLNALNIALQENGLYVINFNRGTGSDPVFDNKLEQAFEQLPDDIKQGLVFYDLVINKSKFGFRGFSSFMDLSIMQKLSRDYMRELNYVVDNFDDLQLYFQYLITKNAVANESRLKSVLNAINEVKAKDKNLILSELGIPLEAQNDFYKVIPKNKKYFKFPYQFISFKGRIFKNIQIRTGSEEGFVAVYKAIDIQNEFNMYSYNLSMDKEDLNQLLLEQPELRRLSEVNFETLLKDKELTLSSNKPFQATNIPNEIVDFPIIVTTNSGKVASVLFSKKVTATLNPEGSAQTHTVSTVEVYKIPKVGREVLQLQQKEANTQAPSEVIVNILDKLSKRFNIKYETINDSTKNWAGMFDRGKVVINLAKAGLDTPFHEFAHPFIIVVKKTNPELYNNLVKEIITEGEILNGVKERYPELSKQNQIEEAIVEAIGIYASQVYDVETNTTLWSLIKELLEYMSNLLKQMFVTPEELSINITLKDLGILFSSDVQVNLGNVNLTLETLLQRGIIEKNCN